MPPIIILPKNIFKSKPYSTLSSCYSRIRSASRAGGNERTKSFQSEGVSLLKNGFLRLGTKHRVVRGLLEIKRSLCVMRHLYNEIPDLDGFLTIAFEAHPVLVPLEISTVFFSFPLLAFSLLLLFPQPPSV